MLQADGHRTLTNMIANMGPNMGANSARQHACGTGRNGKEREANGKGANMCQLLSLDPCSEVFAPPHVHTLLPSHMCTVCVLGRWWVDVRAHLANASIWGIQLRMTMKRK